MGICKFGSKASSYHENIEDSEEHYNLAYDLKKGTLVVFKEGKCRKAEKIIELLTSVNVKPVVIDVLEVGNVKGARKALKSAAGTSSSPFVFIVSKYFGGLAEVEKGVSSHTIQKMVNSRLESIGGRLG